MLKRILWLFASASVVAFGGFFFTGVMQQGSGLGTQTILSNAKFGNLLGEIRRGWREGYAITDINHAPRKWMVVMSKGADVKEQMVIQRRLMSEVREAVDTYNARGWRLSNVENGVGYWTLVFDKAASAETTRLIAYRDRAWFDAHLKRLMRHEGYIVRDIEGAEGYWLAVMEKGSTVQKVYAAEKFDDVERVLRVMWKEGYHVRLLENGNDLWYMVFDKGVRKETVVTAEHYGDFIGEIRRYWRNGYRLRDLAEARR